MRPARAVPVKSSSTVMARSLPCALLLGCLVLPLSAHAHGTLAEKGEKLYEEHCADCHGIDGDGEGPAAAQLSPPPANLLESMQGKIISDEYLMWTIREGGRNVHTDMPAFEQRGTISESDAQAIVRYLWHAFK